MRERADEDEDEKLYNMMMRRMKNSERKKERKMAQNKKGRKIKKGKKVGKALLETCSSPNSDHLF